MTELITTADLPGDERPARELLALEWKPFKTHPMRKPSWDAFLELLGKDCKVLSVTVDGRVEHYQGVLLVSPDGVRKISD